MEEKRQVMEEKKEYIIDETKKFIREVINRYTKVSRQTDKEYCYQQACQEMQDLIRRKYNFQGSKKREQIYQEMIGQTGQELRKYIDDCFMTSRKRMLQQEVNATTAGFIINEKMEAEGIKYWSEMQTYRVKLHVKLNETTKGIFYINYKKLRTDLDKLIPAIRKCQEVVNTFGRYTKVENIQAGETFE